MRLQIGIAINLCAIACLSSFILAVGGEEYWIPGLVVVASLISFYTTDLTRIVRLNDWISNAIVLLLVFLSIGNLYQNRGEELGNGIARIVVLVQVVLLFKEKVPRNCWHIFTLSFLQLVVASVFRQNSWFAPLIMLYTLASFSGLCLMFLHRESRYFQHHSFVRSRQEVMENELRLNNQDKRRMMTMILAALFTGPTALFLSYRERRREDSEPDIEKKSQHGKTRWDVSNFWDDEPNTDDTESETHDNSKFKTQWRGGIFKFKKPREEPKRWSLLAASPKFSGGTHCTSGFGTHAALFAELVRCTVIAIVFAIVIFLLFPRFLKINLLGTEFVRDSWKHSGGGQVATVGFTRDVRLGAVGNVQQNHREVMSIQFYRGYNDEEQFINHNPAGVPFEANMQRYSEIDDKTIYIRGTALTTYTNGTWSDPIHKRDANGYSNSKFSEWNLDHSERVSPLFQPGFRLAQTPGSEYVSMVITFQSLNSNMVFTVWPYYNSRTSQRDGFRILDGALLCDDLLNHTAVLRICTSAFSGGEQEEVTPHQESIPFSVLYELPENAENSLPTLMKLARKWDEESKLPKTDLIARAKFIEAKLSDPNHFRYKLGGITRKRGIDPLEDFVTNNPVGHCEYFASTLALMLRSVGIGSRIIVGYKTVCSDLNHDGYSVRQSEAHAWVEAYLPEVSLPSKFRDLSVLDERSRWWEKGGWLRLDPTPDAGEPPFTIQQGLISLKDFVSNLWNDFFLNLNPSRQYAYIYSPIKTAATWVGRNVFYVGFWKEVAKTIITGYSEIIKDFRSGHWQAGRLLEFIVLPIVLVGVFVFITRLLLKRIVKIINKSNQQTCRQTPVQFYRRTESALKKQGLIRQPSQTPTAFLKQCEQKLSIQLTTIATAYNKVRFNEAVLTDDEQNRVENVIARIEGCAVENK
ncbi:MAG: transglutaminaseTgpA domain-containing protein [Planctomycetaceae bacterium]|jgi:transglutaminase-like putative cysteine protease|nr:transglutaminaseTgpA domain-containing protein [Planctomycetaceae bacterium]